MQAQQRRPVEAKSHVVKGLGLRTCIVGLGRGLGEAAGRHQENASTFRSYDGGCVVAPNVFVIDTVDIDIVVPNALVATVIVANVVQVTVVSCIN